MRSRLLITIIASLICGCGYNRFDDGPGMSDRTTIVANIDIGDIRRLYNGRTAYVYDDMVIGGYVTANDKSGNFYRSFIMEDATGAIEIRTGTYYLHNTLPEGRYVAVSLCGLAIGSYNEVLQAGLPPKASGAYQTEYMGHGAIMNRYVYPADEFRTIEPLQLYLGDLDETLCGRVVRIEGVRLSGEDNDPDEPLWGALDPDSAYSSNSYRVFVTEYGDKIAVVTSNYADFAAEPLPQGTLSLTGILMRGKVTGGKTMYMIKLRSLYDVEII
jgi:hypothetical protein